METKGVTLFFASIQGTGSNFHILFLIMMKGQTMTYTYRMTSHRALAEGCSRYEDDAGRHLLIHQPDSTTTCPFFMDKHDAAVGQARLH